MSKSTLYTAMTTPTAVAINGVVPLGSTIRRFGCNIEQDGNSITLAGRGYYRINMSATVLPSAAGTVTITMLKDGVAVAGATASVSTSVAGNPVNPNIVAVVRNVCDCDSSIISFVLTGTGSTVNNMSVTVDKL